MSTLAIYGMGLIGGSFALAAKEAKLFDRVVGVDSNRGHLEAALTRQICDAELTAREQLDGVCIAVPTRYIPDVLSDVVKRVTESVPIFDTGSVKAVMLANISDLPCNFVPCHPIAGSDKSGPAAAHAKLFRNAVCVVAASPKTDENHLATVKSWWEEIGTVVVEQTPEEHDATVALTSHLPHLLSFALMEMVAEHGESLAAGIGNGFRDFTRLASADPVVWSHILHDNREHIAAAFLQVEKIAGRILDDAVNRPDTLTSSLGRIRQARRAFEESS